MVTDQAKTEKRICVVLDANIWIRERLLNSSIGAAFLYRLGKIDGLFALPEITEKEVISKTVLDGARAVNRIRNDLATVRTLIGKTEEVELPNDESFAQAARDRLRELGDTLIRVEISLSHYKNALERVLLSTPPNAAKEQYRDSLLWEAVLQLSSNYEIAFITNDSDFYESNSLGKGLAGELLKECQSSQSTVPFTGIFRPIYVRLASMSPHWTTTTSLSCLVKRYGRSNCRGILRTKE